jgi:hypothetical protein
LLSDYALPYNATATFNVGYNSSVHELHLGRGPFEHLQLPVLGADDLGGL